MEQEIERRITSTWNRYWSLKEVMKNAQYPFNTCILPCLTYGCQACPHHAHKQKTLQKITSCQKGIERSLLNYNIKDKKRAKDLRKITKLKEATFHTKRLKWRWAGHMVRDRNKKWSKTVTEWQIRDGSKRSRGRQRKRWDDDIVETAGALWARLLETQETVKNGGAWGRPMRQRTRWLTKTPKCNSFVLLNLFYIVISLLSVNKGLLFLFK